MTLLVPPSHFTSDFQFAAGIMCEYVRCDLISSISVHTYINIKHESKFVLYGFLWQFVFYSCIKKSSEIYVFKQAEHRIVSYLRTKENYSLHTNVHTLWKYYTKFVALTVWKTLSSVVKTFSRTENSFSQRARAAFSLTHTRNRNSFTSSGRNFLFSSAVAKKIAKFSLISCSLAPHNNLSFLINTTTWISKTFYYGDFENARVIRNFLGVRQLYAYITRLHPSWGIFTHFPTDEESFYFGKSDSYAEKSGFGEDEKLRRFLKICSLSKTLVHDLCELWLRYRTNAYVKNKTAVKCWI